MPVGSGFGPMLGNKVIQRMEPNPIDKSTIVSVYHKPVNIVKPTVFPGRFTIPAAPSDDDFAMFVVGTSSWWKETDEHSPLLEIPCNSVQVAKAIVNDYIGALLGAQGNHRKPGIFYVPGEYSKTTILQASVDGKPFKVLLDEAREAQKRYYTELVRIADILWSRTNGNPLAISDDARLAAEKLGLKQSKVWMGDFRAMEMTPCKSCGFMVNPNYPICANCKNPVVGMKQ
jgi:hypothetical protein